MTITSKAIDQLNGEISLTELDQVSGGNIIHDATTAVLAVTVVAAGPVAGALLYGLVRWSDGVAAVASGAV